MKSLHILVVVAGLMTLGGNSLNAQAADALRREVEQLNREMSEAAEKGDLKKAASYYADDAEVRQGRNVVARGRAQLDRYFTSIQNLKSWKLEVFDVSGTRDVVYQAGRSTLVSGSPERTSTVEFLVVWKRQPDGKLRIHLDYYHLPEMSDRR